MVRVFSSLTRGHGFESNAMDGVDLKLLQKSFVIHYGSTWPDRLVSIVACGGYPIYVKQLKLHYGNAAYNNN